MSVSQINSGTPLQKNYSVNHNAAPSPEEVASFESSLEAASESASGENQNPSQDNSDGSIPAESWAAYRQGFNQSIFDHDRRELAYYDRVRREIDYGNKP
jgi:hypothetical protein